MEYANVLSENPSKALMALVLLTLLTACGAAKPGDMGVVHGTPAEAASAALGPGGWLGPVASLDLYPIHVTDTAYVAMYTGYDGKNTERPVPVMGATDGQSKGDGWVAHGMYRFSPPDAPTNGLVRCVTGEFISAGEVFITVYGRVASEVGQIEAIQDDAESLSAARLDDTFVAMMPRSQANAFTELTLLDSTGNSITTVPITDCQSE